MKNFTRTDSLFSLCGLNCVLCPMHLDHYCPGCGGGVGNQSCAIARCSQQHNSIEYCNQCDEYPCEKYDGMDEFDSFIAHRNQRKDLDKVKEIGLDAYHSELIEKEKILHYLLENYNDGRRKSFFCLAVNLLSLQDLKSAVNQIIVASESDNLKPKEKATLAVDKFHAIAKQRNTILKLNKKPKKG